tara:strand:+ start:338 stop:841 length:504 start_codon:yes stop_codon:yes gene_type:complete
MKAYDIIILPPEDFYFSINDLYIKNYNLFVKIVKVLCKKYKNKKILIKFRNSDHKNLFNIQHNNVVTSGKILDYANKNCKIIGPPGSIVIESLLKGYNFYSYRAIINPRNKARVFGLNDVLEIANNEKKLMRNLSKNLIFKRGRNRNDLLHKKTLLLKDIVKEILKI